MIQNQFITPQQLAKLHLDSLLIKHARQQPTAKHASNLSIQNVLSQLANGSTKMSKVSQKAVDLLDQIRLSESQKRLRANRQLNAQRSQLNQELYSQNKNKQSQKQLHSSRRILSIAEHSRFIKNMKKDNQKRKEIKQKRQQQKQMMMMEQIEKERKSSQQKRMQELEKRKETIKENLKKMRENHQKMLATQHQSRAVFNQIRKKKRLYQEMQHTQQEKANEQAQQIQKRQLEHRQQSKLDIHQLLNHEKQYLSLRKQKAKTRQNSRVRLHTSQHIYKPPPHSQKLNSIIEQEYKNRHKQEDNKRKIQQKLRKIAQYSSAIKQRFKQRSPTRTAKNATQPEQQNAQSNRLFLKAQINRTEIGNQYLNQAKKKVKKRSKTQQRYYNPQVSTTVDVIHREKTRLSTLGYIPEAKRKQHIQKMKRKQLQKMLKLDPDTSEAQKLSRIKIADERLSIELRKKQEQLKDNYNPEANSAALALLLGTIKAKLNLINSNGHR